MILRAAKKTLSLLVASMMLCNFSSANLTVFAEENPGDVAGKVYSFEEKANYEYSKAKTFETAVPGENTYGDFSLSGSVTSDGVINEIPSYLVSEGTASFVYSYTDELLKADEESWHLIEDKSKKVDDISLSSNIQNGALILQTSKDGKNWFTDTELTNQFKTKPKKNDAFYSANSVQLANGTYFRLIVVYKTGRKVGQNQYLFISTDEYEYKEIAEVYEFYLHDNSINLQDNPVMSKNLGTLTNTGKDNGYSGNNPIDIDDPHYGWEIGHFFVSGYTRETEDDAKTPVFLKNVNDQITLWFNLEQDINSLNGDPNITINSDGNGYDRYFQTSKTDMGRGTLIIRYTDEKGVKHDPEIYTDYLQANASTSADTIVRLFEEGDYEVALDYEIKNTPRKIAGVEVVPEYSNYRVFFKFKVRNGNCMIFPFDVATGNELSNQAITPNGFKLDMAKSRYLTVDVKKSVVTESSDGYAEDVRFNRPAKDGDEYTEEGIYEFSVKNLYTGETTTKTIYVGESNYLKALSVNKLTVQELNAKIEKGGKIGDDGSITMTSKKWKDS